MFDEVCVHCQNVFQVHRNSFLSKFYAANLVINIITKKNFHCNDNVLHSGIFNILRPSTFASEITQFPAMELTLQGSQ
jgi:hypothetical protein